jgi:integrase
MWLARASRSLVRLFPPHLTFAQLAQQWLDDSAQRLRSSWHSECGRLLARDLRELGELRADKVSRRDIARVLEGIAAPGIARNALAIVRCIFRWSLATGRLDQDPTLGLRRRAARARERVLSEGELRAIWSACEPLDDYGRIVRLLLLTGQRRDEISDLAWSEVDLERRHIELPGTRTKNRRPHVVPLSEMALALLPPLREGYPHIFGRRPGSGFSGWSRSKVRLDQRIVQADGAVRLPPWTLHDLRRSFVTHALERGIAEPHVIEAVLNHISGHKAGVAGTYNRAAYAAPKRAALEAWVLQLQDRILR